MLASFPASRPSFGSLLSGLRLPDVRALAARCGDDVVRLRPAWPALIAATRFARHATWLFGNHAAVLECVEARPNRWLTQRRPGDPFAMQFDLRTWHSAYACCESDTREISVFAADGSSIASVHIDAFESTLDELIWLLVDDDRTPERDAADGAGIPAVRGTFVPDDIERLRDTLALVERRDDFERIVARAGITHHLAFGLAGPDIARPLAVTALQSALLAAVDARIPLRIRLTNAGGSVAWSPNAYATRECTSWLEVHSQLGRMLVNGRLSRVWAVALSDADGALPALEAYGSDDLPWLRVTSSAKTPPERATWRRLCATLAEG